MTNNTDKMKAAVARWIAEAQSRRDGPTLLRQKATWLGHQIRMAGDPLTRTPENMDGVNAADALTAQADLRNAAAALAKAQSMKVAA